MTQVQSGVFSRDFRSALAVATVALLILIFSSFAAWLVLIFIWYVLQRLSFTQRSAYSAFINQRRIKSQIYLPQGAGRIFAVPEEIDRSITNL